MIFATMFASGEHRCEKNIVYHAAVHHEPVERQAKQVFQIGKHSV